MGLTTRLSGVEKRAREANSEFFQLRNLHVDSSQSLVDLSSVLVESLARLLSNIESRFFNSVEIPELLFSNWKRKEKRELCPALMNLIDWFNRVPHFLRYSLINFPDHGLDSD